jgi:hypothetical protein
MRKKRFLKSYYLWIIIGLVILFIILFTIKFKIQSNNLTNEQIAITKANQEYIKNIKSLKKQYISKVKILEKTNKELFNKTYNNSTNLNSISKLTLSSEPERNQETSNNKDKTLLTATPYSIEPSTDTEIKEKGEVMDSNSLNNPPPPPSPTLHL